MNFYKLTVSLAAALLLYSCADSSTEKTATNTNTNTSTQDTSSYNIKGIEDSMRNDTTHQHPSTITAGGSANYSIQPPAGWTKTADKLVRGGGKYVQLTSPEEPGKDQFRESVNVITEKLLKPGLDNYVSSGKENMLKHITGITIIKEGDATVAGLPAKWIKYGFMFGPAPHTNIAYLFIKDDIGYVITCNAETSKYDQYEPQFKQAVNSFTFTQ